MGDARRHADQGDLEDEDLAPPAARNDPKEAPTRGLFFFPVVSTFREFPKRGSVVDSRLAIFFLVNLKIRSIIKQFCLFARAPWVMLFHQGSWHDAAGRRS